ncbi:o-acyltransferase [Anaeramoeba flamelloides]|uniref:O-acyltransferase n=1 Tax=Anaeramoeba flamelloides TaxID=1746091 RepID=A0AAV7YXL8_9EUKA|nr:o-acyltransferase [Anaeramoeba flamelloides]
MASLTALMTNNYPNATQMIEATSLYPDRLGDWYLCQSLKEERVAHYCVAFVTLDADEPQFPLGTCMPLDCSEDDLSTLSPIILSLKGLKGSAKFYCDNPQVKGFGFYFMTTFCLALLFIVLAATLVDYYLFQENKPFETENETESDDKKAILLDSESYSDSLLSDAERDFISSSEKSQDKQITINNINEIKDREAESLFVGLNKEKPEIFHKVIQKKVEETNLWKFLKQFSLIQNCHTYDFIMSFPVFNTSALTDIFKKWSIQMIIGGEFGVDSFFFMSGFLACYGMMKTLKKFHKLPAHLAYIHRFLRLTPTMMFVIFVSVYLGVNMGVGPMWPMMTEQMTSKCTKYWWTNLLFINNWYPRHYTDSCLGQTWYLANDFQFFIIAPLIVWIAWKSRKVGYAVIACIIAGSITYKCLIVHHWQLTINIHQSDMHYYDWIYIKPMARIDVYLIGILLCLLLWDEKNKGGFHLKKITIPQFYIRWLMFCIGLAIIGLCIFSPYSFYKGEKWPRWLQTLYVACDRPLYTIGLALLVLLWINGYMKPLSTILSADFWTVPARLTYCAYLVHPTIIYIFYFNNKKENFLSNITIIVYYLAMLPIAYIVGLIFSLCFESPFMNLEKMLIEKLKSLGKKK